MPLTSQDVERLVAWYERLDEEASGSAPDRRERLAAAARPHKLFATLVSAWMAEGVPVSPAFLAEVAQQRARSEGYVRLVDELAAGVGADIQVHKGSAIASLYPAGWLRSSADLDIQVAGTDQVVAVGRYLLDRGWCCNRLVVFRRNGAHELALDLVDEASGVVAGKRAVQVQGFAFRGDVWSVPPRQTAELRASSPHQSSVLALLESLTHRPMVARDVLDFHLLMAALTSDGRAHLNEALDDLDLWPEWQQIEDAMSRCGLGGAGDRSDWGRRLRRHAVRRRAVRRVSRRLFSTVCGAWPGGREAALLAAGFPLAGVPQADDDGESFALSFDRGGTVRFRGPLGHGRLHFDGRF